MDPNALKPNTTPASIPPPPGGGQAVPNPHWQPQQQSPVRASAVPQNIPPPPSGVAVVNPHFQPAQNATNASHALKFPLTGPLSPDIEDRRDEGVFGKVRDFAEGIYAQGKYQYELGKRQRYGQQ